MELTLELEQQLIDQLRSEGIEFPTSEQIQEEFESYLANLDAIALRQHEAEQAERERIQIFKDRFLSIYREDAGMPAFSILFPDKPNCLAYLNQELLCLPTDEAETIMAKIELEDANIKEQQRLVAYRELRRNEYPPITDQLDELVKATYSGNNSGWIAIVEKCIAVKNKYPKPVKA